MLSSLTTYLIALQLPYSEQDSEMGTVRPRPIMYFLFND
jgi:hypothetical protein